ncbi:hypothetical protein C1645_826304, partial [Glomus cerebriforme]
MELSNTFNENSFNPTPRLKSSPVPILFIPFNINEKNCGYCGDYYSVTLLSQKYCKNCLSKYFKDNNADAYLDVHIRRCSKSNNKINRNCLEWCESCLVWMYNHTGEEILQFKQIIPLSNDDLYEHDRQLTESEKVCKLCGKLIYKQTLLCSNCYLISSGWVKSTLAKKLIPILYLPWWDAYNNCVSCKEKLIFLSDCQKWCSYCIIFYTECRYCLTTNIIFGIADQSQCKKCKRISFITIDMTNIKGYFLEINIRNHKHIANYVNNVNKNSNPLEVYNFIISLYIPFKPLIDWISYSPVATIPIMFIPFDDNTICHYCRRLYSKTLLFKQKYCKHCLFLYIAYTTDNINIKNIIDMDVYVCANNIKCDKHEPRDLDFCTQNIQEWCKICSE